MRSAKQNIITADDIRVLDCIKGMATLEPGSVDVAVTSPPYNPGIGCAKPMDSAAQNIYLDWSIAWIRAVHRVLKKSGSLFLNLGRSPINPTIPHELICRIASDKEFVLQNELHWAKSITVPTDKGREISKGPYKPVKSGRFLNDCHESIFHLTPTGNTPINCLAVGVEDKHKTNLKRWEKAEGLDRRCGGNVWFFAPCPIHNRKKGRPHPTTFPIELPERCIRLHGCNPRPVVMDPFMGTGSTWIASIRCNAERFIGFEIDESYVELAKQYAADRSVIWPDSN